MRKSSAGLPFLLAQTAFAAWGTIWHRSLLMAQGTCSPAEYQRMVAEKIAAAQLATVAALTGQGAEAILRPYLSRARTNHRRLGKSKPSAG